MTPFHRHFKSIKSRERPYLLTPLNRGIASLLNRKYPVPGSQIDGTSLVHGWVGASEKNVSADEEKGEPGGWGEMKRRDVRPARVSPPFLSRLFCQYLVCYIVSAV